MDKVANLPADQRKQLISETAARIGITPAIIEKDFWVCWTLNRLFSTQGLSDKILFKGGTSLSKVYNLIERFSEDIDLILNWDEITDEDPLQERSGKKQRQFNQYLLEMGHQYIREALFPDIHTALKDCCELKLSLESPAIIYVRYPSSYSQDYLLPEIRLEIGPRALWCPNDRHSISPYIADIFPNQFEKINFQVQVVTAERTFWEKVTILHHEANRPEHSQQPSRYSRHYYDIARMAQSSVKNKALEKLDLLDSVVQFKKKFFPRGWAQYDKAVPGTLKLIPKQHLITELQKDYKQMQVMIYGEIPSFDQIVEILDCLENEINLLI